MAVNGHPEHLDDLFSGRQPDAPLQAPAAQRKRQRIQAFYDQINDSLSGSIYADDAVFFNFGYLPDGGPRAARIELPPQWPNRNRIDLVLELIGDCNLDDRDILDVFNVNPAELRRCSWHDPAKAPDYDAMSDEELVIHARNWEALCLYAWHPYMYNPQLPRWLGRIKVPTLLLWGECDQVVTPDYGRAYSRLIPGARFEVIEEAGHHPELEQPERFAERVAAFLKE